MPTRALQACPAIPALSVRSTGSARRSTLGLLAVAALVTVAPQSHDLGIKVE